MRPVCIPLCVPAQLYTVSELPSYTPLSLPSPSPSSLLASHTPISHHPSCPGSSLAPSLPSFPSPPLAPWQRHRKEPCHVFSASINDIYQLERTRRSQSHTTRWLGADHQRARRRPPASSGPRAQTQVALGLAGSWVQAAGRDGGESKVLPSSNPSRERGFFQRGEIILSRTRFSKEKLKIKIPALVFSCFYASSLLHPGCSCKNPSRSFAPVMASLSSCRGLRSREGKPFAK